MTADDYLRAFEAAKREFEELGEQRRGIDRRLTQLAQTMASLGRLCGYTPTVSWGLTDGCRMVLIASGRPMTPTEVRDSLAACGFDMSKYANDLAAIHTVLKRLNEAGEVRFVAQASGKHAYVYAAGRSWPVFTGIAAEPPAAASGTQTPPPRSQAGKPPPSRKSSRQKQTSKP